MKQLCKYITTLTFTLITVMQCSFIQAQQLRWVIPAGSGKDDNAVQSVLDKKGNLFVLGSFGDTLQLHPASPADTLHAVGKTDIFLAKYDTSGNYIWSKKIGTEGYAYGRAMAIDHADNIFIAGSFAGTVDIQTLSGPVHMETPLTLNGQHATQSFVCKLNAAGDYLWAKQIGEGSRGFSSWVITTDPAGNVITAGSFTDSADLDPGPGTDYVYSDPNGVDIFVCKLGADGSYHWGGSAGGWWADFPYGITTDAQGDIYITGFFGNIVDFDPGPGTHMLYSQGIEDIFVWKLRSNGTLDWAKNYGGPSWDDWGTGISLDAAGNIYLTGSFEDSATFDQAGTFKLISYGGRDIFACKLNPSGDPIWVKNMGGKGEDRANDLAMDADGNMYITGYFSDTAVFPGGQPAQLISSGKMDIFFCKLDNNGNMNWARSIGTAANGYTSENATSIITDAYRSVYITGYFRDTLDFDPGDKTQFYQSRNGSEDAFIMKLLCSDDKKGKVTDTACGSYTLGQSTYTKSGMYQLTLQNTSGCDSIFLDLDLTINQIVKPEIQAIGKVITTAIPYTTYQWYKNGIAETDSTNRSYTITENGDYRVAVTNEHGCSDTSKIYQVNNVSVTDRYINAGIRIYPNPAKETLFIDSPEPYRIRITDIRGRKVKEAEPAGHTITVADLQPGVYYAHIIGAGGEVIYVQAFVKE